MRKKAERKKKNKECKACKACKERHSKNNRSALIISFIFMINILIPSLILMINYGKNMDFSIVYIEQNNSHKPLNQNRDINGIKFHSANYKMNNPINGNAITNNELYSSIYFDKYNKGNIAVADNIGSDNNNDNNNNENINNDNNNNDNNNNDNNNNENINNDNNNDNDNVNINFNTTFNNISNDLMKSHYANYSEDWYQKQIKYLIIARDQEASVFEPLAEWKIMTGVPAKIVNSSEYLSYPGRDVAEKIRNCIKSYYDNYSIQWVLLGGDSDLIPVRYVYNPDTVIVGEAEYGNSDQYRKPTDYYYADLSGTWDTDNDSNFGESLHYADEDEIDWSHLDVSVGRFPGDNSNELATMVNKTIFYEEASNIGSWMHKILLGGAIQVNPNSDDHDGELELKLTQKIIEESVQGKMDYIHLVERDSSNYGYNNLTEATFNYYFNKGVSIAVFAGHGSPSEFDGINFYRPRFYSIGDAQSSTNYEMPAFVYADACSTNFFDRGYNSRVSGDCIGEELLKRSRGGAIGYIGAMRLSWFYSNDTYTNNEGQEVSLVELNRGMTRLFFQQLFLKGIYQQGLALNSMRKAYLNSEWLTNNYMDGPNPNYNIHNIEWERKNLLTYNLLGDPELDIFTEEPLSFSPNIFNAPTYYGGQSIDLIIRNQYNNIVPNATLCIMGEDGAYNTFHADSVGHIKIRLPIKAQQYNYTITAHNMIPYNGNFTTINDTKSPMIIGTSIKFTPYEPNTDCNTNIEINATDNETGILIGFLVLTKDNFKTYTYYAINQSLSDGTFSGEIPKLECGLYKYAIFVFDYSKNVAWYYCDNDIIYIKTPIMINGIILLNLVFGMISIITIYHDRKNREIYQRNFEIEKI
ncbi:MAG: C25 family cysteine peptidase [Promethearchaeota archaeon]